MIKLYYPVVLKQSLFFAVVFPNRVGLVSAK